MTATQHRDTQHKDTQPKDTQVLNDEPTLSASDFRGNWIIFDDKDGRCPAQLLSGRVVINPAVLNPAAKLVLRFENLEGFPAGTPIEADFLGDGLDFELEGTAFKIIRCDRIGRARVIHCTSKLSSTGIEPGSWTAEEEDGGEDDGVSKASCDST